MKKAKKNFDWWLTGICFARAFNGLVFMTYAAALPILQKEWGMSASAAGAIAGAFQIGYALSLITMSSLADRIGPKILYLYSMSGSAVLSLIFAFFARDYWSGLILYTLLALSLGGNYTTALMIMADRYPVHRRGMAMGFFIASTSLGYAMSLMLSGATIPIGGYQLSFFTTCSGPIVGAVLAWITLIRTDVRKPERKKDLKFSQAVLGNRPVMLLIGGYSGHTWELLGMWAWTPTFLSASLMLAGSKSLQAAGVGAYITAAFHLIGLIASFTMGNLSDRLGRAKVIIVLAGISTLFSFLYGWTINWPLFWVIILGFIYAFSSIGDSPVLSAAMTEAVDPSYLGAAYGLRSFLGFGAGAVSPIVFGVVLDLTNRTELSVLHYQSWGWAFSTFGIGGLVAVWAAFLFRGHDISRS